MAYDSRLAERLREILPEAEEKHMFGGMGFLERGNLVVGVRGDEMIARVGPAATAKALREPGVRPFAVAARPMSGWVLVSQEVVPEVEELQAWIDRCRSFTNTLPAK